MRRATKTATVTLPAAIVKEVESLAKQENRSSGELMRDMVRVYRQHCRARDEDEDVDWFSLAVAAAEAEGPKTREEILAEDDELARYGEMQAKKLGIKAKDIDRIIHEYRRSRRASRRS